MATLDEIANEKQRVSEALARVDAQREKLAGQLAELEATERVLARYSKGSGVRRTASARTPNAARKAASPARAGGQPRTATTKSAGRKRSSPSLNDQVLALADGRRSQRSPLRARALARTTSAPPLPGISGRAASKSGMESSTPRSPQEQNKALRSDTGRAELSRSGLHRCGFVLIDVQLTGAGGSYG